MKQLLVIFLLLLSFHSGKSQSTDTSRVEQYCEVICTARLFSNKVTVDVDFGEFRQYLGGNHQIKDMEGHLKKFNGVTDALNYVALQGWVLVNAYAVGTGGSNSIYHFFFKKSFLRSEIVDKE